MDEEAANVFMTNLVKNIQMLCHGHLPFSDNVEVIGHLYLNIDCGKKLNYIVNEKYSKLNQATTFTSNSFHAEPSKDKSSHAKNSSNAPELHGNVRKFKRAAKSLSVSSSPSKVRKIREEYRDDPVNDVNDSVDNSLGVTFSIQRNDNDQERIPSINSSNVIIKSETNQHTFKTEVENPTPTLEGDPSDVQYASGSTSNPNDSYSSFYSPADGEFEDFQAATNQTMLAVSGYTAEEVLYSKDPSIQPLLSSIIKEASIQCGIWEQVPYPKDIPTHTREMFFDFVLSIAPQLESHRDVIWSKLSHRLRDRRFKQKLKKARFFK
ncbi:uncharacterized protein LOC126815510 isoform X3 [Patella vulgata]|uniref:uncharacterized protein LOC126815510 isoform X3 n=1 Tax=Patella vulgata TaxID=6465 RepID=UPI00217F68AB|nr:uncharacterized protein LOC126815510 isoform X3 [Patella vulgata]